MKWLEAHFDERQRKEVEFCRIYAGQFNHGTDGHNAKLIIAKMAEVLNSVEVELLRNNWDEELAPKARKALGIEGE